MNSVGNNGQMRLVAADHHRKDCSGACREQVPITADMLAELLVLRHQTQHEYE